MRIGVTGAKGRLGSLLVSEAYNYYPIDCYYTGDDEAVRSAVKEVKPDVIIHCAGYTDVDGAELNPADANVANGLFVVALRESFEGRLILLSTDYIFDGKDGPYTEEAKPNPICAYGRSKLLGESLLKEFGGMDNVIVRTTILYGSPTSEKSDFVSSILGNLSRVGRAIAPTKIFGSPTYIPHLAEALSILAKIEKAPSVINVSGSDTLSRYEFAQLIAEVFGYGLDRIGATDYGYGIANRPKRAGLITDKAAKLGLPICSVAQGLVALKVALNGK